MSKNHTLTIDPRILAQAADWFAVLSSGNVQHTETAKWQAWLEAHPDHRAAWDRVEFFTGKFNALPAQSASAALNAPDLYRRRMLVTLSGLAIVGFSGWQVTRGQYWQDWTADYRADFGASKTITLADGSTVILDSDSALNVEFTTELRRLQLVSGEIYIETAPDSLGRHRPFVVDTHHGRVRALGTRFSIAQQANTCQVNVFADAVEIQPVGSNSAKQIVHAGQQARFNHHQIEPIQPNSLDRPAWTQGMIVADSMPLSEFLLQLNRYRRGYVSCAPEIADLRIVGSFPLNDTNKILASLQSTLPVKLSSPLPFWTKILPR